MPFLKPNLVLEQIWLVMLLLAVVPSSQAQIRGDINLNYIPYETADLVLFDEFLLYGDSVLVDPYHQGLSSDVNYDIICWTIADLIHLERVIAEDADPAEQSIGPSSAQVLFDIGHAQAMPHDTVSLPITYFTWGDWQSIHGLDWRIRYDSDKLTLFGVDLSGGRLEDWDEVHYRIEPGELRFSARPEYYTTSLSDSLPIAYPDTALLATLDFLVSTADTPVYVPIDFVADTVPCYDLLPLSFACIDSSVTRTGGRGSFTGGGIQVGTPPKRGDINLNSVAYEVADLVLFAEYLLYGDSILIDPPQQYANSDVNWDDFAWSMADFVHLARVILHDAPQVSEPTSQSALDLYTWVTKVHNMPNDTLVLPVWYSSPGTTWIDGISFKIDYHPDSLTLLGVDFSETPLEDWQHVYVRSENGSVRVNACPEFLTMSLSDSMLSDYVPRKIAKLVFVVSDVDTPAFIPVSFGDDTSSQIQANAFADVDGPLTRLGISDTRDGGIYVGGTIECKRGDINFNNVSYEVADWVLFNSFLVNGPGVLIYDPEVQTCASDVNADLMYWTIADFLYLIRVILNDSPEIPGKGREGSGEENLSDELRLVSSSAHPGQVVSVPIWLSNSTNAWGTTFKVRFDEDVLAIEGMDVVQTRIEEWDAVNPVLNPGELFLFALANWPYEDHSYQSIGSGQGVLIRVNFRVDDGAVPGTSLPISFEIDEDWGHYNAYTDTTGLTFVQPSTVSGWVYTDVISGDANSDGIVDVADLVYLINYLYKRKWPPSPESLGDFTQDGEVDASDVVALINYLFRR